MAVRKSKVESEKLTDERLLRAIEMLEPTTADVKPLSKKEVCEYLGITYNTTRLSSLITEFKEKVALDKAMREERKGTPATKSEISFCVNSYLLDDMPISKIAEALYRSTSFVNKVLREQGITFKPTSHDYFNPPVISDQDARDRFEVGETVYNARYNVNCIIKDTKEDPLYGYVHKVWLLGDYQQFAYTAAYDLGSLDVLKRVNEN